MSSPSHQERTRYLIANEAARIMVEQQEDDFARARAKAAERLACKNRKLLPDNSEIARALEDYLQLYAGAEHWRRQAQLRQAAAEAMASLADFRPHLVGPVLRGTAGPHSPIQLYLYPEYPEQLAIHLLNMGIHYSEADREVRFGGGQRRPCPVFRFLAGAHEVELICLSDKDQRSPPLSSLDNRPESGADLAQLKTLLAAGGHPGHNFT